MTDIMKRFPKPIVIALVLVLLVGAFLLLRPGTETRTVTAHFSRAVSIFEDTEVRILGVPVGRVTAVVPEGNTVRVEMEYDSQYPVPDDAKAVIVTPTLTADRFIQLSPTYTDGAKLPDDAVIEVEDTGTPIELDRIYKSLSDVTRALGPNGVNRNGTLDNVLGAGAKFLDGQGKKANTTIVNMSQAVQVFADGSGDLFGTVRALDEFTGALAANDAAVGSFLGNLGAVSQQLAAEKDELAAALQNLAGVLAKVESFVRGNRESLTKNVESLTTILGVMADERAALETVLDIGPAAMGNLHVAFDPKSGSIGSRINLQGNLQDLDNLLCQIVRNGDITAPDQACEIFKTLLEPLEQELEIPISSLPTQPRPESGTTSVEYGSARPAGSLTELLGGAA
jgi:phospholipid/cholesterol/gamma-HCH transport system substrate-binding protein